jgi:hypothetical protein
MADPVTTNRSLAQPTRGSDPGTWDVPMNGNSGLLDTILGGVATIATSGGTITLNAAQLACGLISITGNISSTVTILFPAIQGWWSIENLCIGNQLVQISAGTQIQNIGIPPGEITDIQVYTNAVKYRNLGRVGSYIDMAVSSVPLWIAFSTVPPYLNCDGSAFNTSTYPALAAYLGGGTLPDLRGRSRAYLNGGTGRITTAGSGIDGNTVFSAGGTQSLTIGQTNLPAVSPTFSGSPVGITVTSTRSDVLFGSSVSAASGGNFTGGQLSANGALTATGSVTAVGSISQLGSGIALASMNPVTISGITMIRAG